MAGSFSDVAAQYDIIVLGSGIAGSIAALVLQQSGLKTLVVERKTHPRFVIGEGTLPTTTLLLNHLARIYQIPELAQVSHYTTLRDAGCAAWPKQTFWFGVQKENMPLAQHQQTLFEALLLPVGPDVHMLRADADAFLAASLEKYGVAYVENTELVDYQAHKEGVSVKLVSAGIGKEVRASFVVDATGHASFLAKRFGLRDEDSPLKTNTRSMFGHFRDVRDLDETLGGCHPDFRFRRTSGTMHHCIRGGWIWVIPFDNGVTSVGVQLDQRIHPLDESITPEQELQALLDRYPTIKAHLGDMKPVRPLIRTGRVQFTSKSILGDGFVLTPHASCFIEPLFSSGILLTVTFIARFARAARKAKATSDWNFEQFRNIERYFFAEVAQVDRLVNGTIQSFRDYDLFKQYWRLWVMGTMAQWFTSVLVDGATGQSPMLYGSGIPGYPEMVARMHELVCRFDDDPKILAAQIKEAIEPWWQHICGPVLITQPDNFFVIGSQRPQALRGAGDGELLKLMGRKLADELKAVDSAIDFRNLEAYLQRAGDTLMLQLARYASSKQDGTDYHRGYERVLYSRNPDTFDYHEAIGLKSA